MPPKRALGPLDLAAIGLNATVGSGIFLLPDDLYRAMGPLSPLAFLLCALGLYPIAVCYAEASRRTVESGGPYVYATEAFGEHVGFAVGWMSFSNAVISFAAVAAAAASYAQTLIQGQDQTSVQVGFALLIIAVFGALNYWGARPGAMAIRLFTFGKFAVLLLLISVLLPEMSCHRVDQARGAFTWSGVGSATFMALFALQGFEVVPVPAGESHSPQTTVPRAVLGTVAVCALFYVIVQCVLVFGFAAIARPSDAPLADAALALSPALGIVVAVGALISTLGFVSGSALGTPRYLHALAARAQVPAFLGRLHPVFHTPHVAILATCAVAAVLVVGFDYRTLIGMSNVAVAVQYGATCGAVLRQRRAERLRTGQGRSSFVPLLGVAASAWICVAATKEELVFAAEALALGMLVHVSQRR